MVDEEVALALIRARVKAATPDWCRVKLLTDKTWRLGFIREHTAYPLEREEDIAFAEHAVTDVEHLLGVIDAKDAEIDRLKQKLQEDLGGGTTAAVAVAEGLRAVGFEYDVVVVPVDDELDHQQELKFLAEKGKDGWSLCSVLSLPPAPLTIRNHPLNRYYFVRVRSLESEEEVTVRCGQCGVEQRVSAACVRCLTEPGHLVCEHCVLCIECGGGELALIPKREG